MKRIKQVNSDFIDIHYSVTSRGTFFNKKIRKVAVYFTHKNKNYKKELSFKAASKKDDRDMFYLKEAQKKTNQEIKNGNLLKYVKKTDKNKKTNLLFCAITLGVTLVVSILGTLLLTHHLGDAYTIFNALFVKVEMPPVFGTLHLISLPILVVATFLVVFFLRKRSELTFRIFLFSIWIMLIALEFIKQFLALHAISGDELVCSYNWSQFPFQLCSMPYFVLPFIIYLKGSKARDALIIFFVTFLMFGGLCAFLYPSFTDCVFINYHTLFHHGCMIVLAIYMAVYYRNKLNLRNLLLSGIPFIITLSIASILNEVVWQNVLVIHSGETVFNMFWFSPHFITVLPILSDIQPAVPYPVFLMIYIIGAFLASYIILLADTLIIRHKIKPCITLKSV